jgi:hypothetical protein
MHHKRRRPKNARAGCLLCKPHKANGCKRSGAGLKRQHVRARVSAREQIKEFGR